MVSPRRCILEISLLFITLTTVCQGLVCYQCYNARNDGECRKKGKVVVCQESQKSCQTTERIDYVQGPIVKISKRCKQARACQNNYKQNNNRREPQCNHFPHLSVCRCCCVENYCNFNTDTCTGVTSTKLLRETNRILKCRAVKKIENGVVICDNKNNLGSKCHFRCYTFFNLHGPSTISCQVHDKKAKWSEKIPCCSKSCPPHGYMDLVVAVDTSFNDEDDAAELKTFLKKLFNAFLIGQKESRIGLVTFDEKIAEKEEIFLSSHNSSIDLQNSVDELKFHKGQGEGVRIAQLLTHISQNSFSSRNGNRPEHRDIFIVITLGKVMKEKEDPETISKLMRDNGIQIVSIALGSSTTNDIIAAIAGSKDNFVSATQGFETFSDQRFLDEIIQIICGDNCSRSTLITEDSE